MGRNFEMAVGSAPARYHPLTMINWYDMLKWCNAKSLMEGLRPVYEVKGARGHYSRGGIRCGWGIEPDSEAPGERLSLTHGSGVGMGRTRRHQDQLRTLLRFRVDDAQNFEKKIKP